MSTEWTQKRPSLARLLLERERWLDEALRRRLRAAGQPDLARAHSLVFANLERDGARISELARRAGVSRQALQKTVAELQRSGLVELATDPSNRSAKIVRLTPAGRDLDRHAGRGLARLERTLVERIGDDRVTALRAALEADWGPVPD